MGIGNGMGKVNGIGYGIDNLYESNRHLNGQSRSVWQEIFHLFPFPSLLLVHGLLVFPGDTPGGAAVKCQRYFYRLS